MSDEGGFGCSPFAIDNFSISTALLVSQSVPEPASMALLGAGIFGLGMIRRRKAA